MGRHHHNNLSALCQAFAKEKTCTCRKVIAMSLTRAWAGSCRTLAKIFTPAFYLRHHLRRHFHLRRRSEELELVAKFSTAALATSRIFTPHASSPRHEETPQPFG